MKILVPMAGEGSRFVKAGYSFPKPLIDVEGRPMIQRVIEDFLFFDPDFIFLVRAEHLERFELSRALQIMTKGRCQILPVPNLTEGAACTALLAKEFINDGCPLLIANSDQAIEWDARNFDILRSLARNDEDFIFTFNATNPKWSFVRVNESYEVEEVAEKKPISNIATCGIYYWGQGSAFVSCAEEMISRNLRVNNEFYIAPAFNVGIERGRKVYPFYVNKMWGLGTPEDLNAYLNRAQR